MRWTIVVAAAGLLLTACGGSSSDEPGRNENLAATTSRSPLRVSEEAACDLFFETDDAPGPRANAIIMTAAEDPTLSDIDSSQVHEVIEDLDSVAKRAPRDWEPIIAALQGPLREIEDALIEGSDASIDLQDYRAAGFEIAARCEE